MASSDSESFESADEDFRSDDEVSDSSLDGKGKVTKVVEIKEPVQVNRVKEKVQGPPEADLKRDELPKENELQAEKSVLITKEPEPRSGVQTTELLGSEVDGWDVDDWGDESFTADDLSTTKKPAETPLFPVRPDSADLPPSKLATSTFDTFPVLKTLNKTTKLSATQTEHLFDSKQQVSEDTKSITAALSRLTAADTVPETSWGWKPWGNVVSLISNASVGVANLTSQVTSAIGVPDPAEMARITMEERRSMANQPKEEPSTPITEEKSSISGFVSGVTNIGTRVLSGGLDTLEGIGKKTMTILQENDPGLINKRKMLGLDSDRPILSQVLREAKERTEETERNYKLMQKQQYKKKLHFETLFDDYCGLVHLEALEMLSKQSILKLESLMAPLSGVALTELQSTLAEVKELCDVTDLENEDDPLTVGRHTSDQLNERLSTAIVEFPVPVDFSDLLKCWSENLIWLNENSECLDGQQIYDKALRCLAQSTATAVNKMHKLAELLLIQDYHNTASEAESLVQLTTILCCHLSGIANRFGSVLIKLENKDDTSSSLVTSIFLEGSNSSFYIQNALQLFIPILQIGAA